MDRRTASAVVVLALAAIVVIAAWLLRADGAPTPVAAPPDPPLGVAAPRAAAASAPAVVSDPEVPATPAPASPAAAAATPAPIADRLVTPDEKALRTWSPKGRIVEAGTGKPIFWSTVWIQIRRSDNPAAVETRVLERGRETSEDPEVHAAFDLASAYLLRGDATLDRAAVSNLEYRVGARAYGHRSASTPWRPLRDGPSAGVATIQLESDPFATLIARVRNADGSPFRGHVSANFVEDDREVHGGYSADTDVDGVARLREVPSGELEVRLVIHVREPGAWAAGPILTGTQRVSLPAGASVEAEFTLPARGEVAILWTDASGSPLRGNWTQVEGHAGYSAHVERILGLPSGPASLVLRVKGYRTWKSTVQVVAGQVTKVEARFEPGEDPK